MSRREDLYIILEIERAASVNDIKRAFRRLARRFHPDINPGDHVAEERFKRISEAYEILSDVGKRQFYDQNGFYSDGVLDPAVPPAMAFRFQGFDSAGGPQSSLNELFGQFFSRQAGQRRAERGNDVEYQMSITFEDSIRGLRTKIAVQRRHVCEACTGLGFMAAPKERMCSSCAGNGTVVRMKGRLQFAVACAECGGRGRMSEDCPECAGDGRVLRTDILEVETPAGVSTASRVRFPGQGDAGKCGGPSGDLNVITNVAPHPFFVRTGDSIQCVLPITFSEAVLGAKVEVPTIDGRAVARIPPGTQNGQTFRIRGKGAPSLVQPGMRGDQVVEVRVVVPRVADERSKEILREFSNLNAEDPRKDLVF